MNIVKIFKDWWANGTAETQQKILRDERERIGLKEINGKVFVVCGGVAIEELPASTTIRDITNKLSGMRDAAVAYKKTDWEADERQASWQPRTEMVTVAR